MFGDGHAKINLLGEGENPELVWAERMSRSEVRRAMLLVAREQQQLIERWTEIHG